MNKNITMRIILVLYATLIVYLSLKPVTTAPDIENIDKAAHLAAYMIMSLFCLMSFRGSILRAGALLSAIMLGAILEWLQSYVPGRSLSYADGVANGVGVITGLLFFSIWNYARGYLQEREKGRGGS